MIKNIIPRLTLLVILFVILFSTQKLEASWKSAQEGNKIILIRHALAPGTGDPAGFKIDDCSTQRNLNQVGIDQRSLSGKEVNLTEAITANSAARSRIMDTDFAKEQSNSIRLQILQQTATAALSQANMGPQAVLGFLG